MLHPDRTFKIKLRSRWIVFEIMLTSAVIYIKAFCMETRLPNILKTTKVTKLTKTILEKSYRVLQVISKLKKLKRPVYILRAVVFWATFDIQIDITLTIF